jgi:hypothetical protein
MYHQPAVTKGNKNSSETRKIPPYGTPNSSCFQVQKVLPPPTRLLFNRRSHFRTPGIPGWWPTHLNPFCEGEKNKPKFGPIKQTIQLALVTPPKVEQFLIISGVPTAPPCARCPFPPKSGRSLTKKKKNPVPSPNVGKRRPARVRPGIFLTGDS